MKYRLAWWMCFWLQWALVVMFFVFSILWSEGVVKYLIPAAAVLQLIAAMTFCWLTRPWKKVQTDAL
jgi:hypothetical protein